jgi:uncharacterized membrane protein YfcA
MPSFAFLSEPLFWLVAVAAFVAALVRGFSGFGAGMIFMPAAAACVGPKTAAGILFIVDSVLIVPFVVRALPIVEWREVLPLGLAAVAMVPAGVAVLVAVDPAPIRWGISLAVIASVAVLALGWRYRGPTRVWASVLVGAVAGFMSGSAQLPGPPVIVYWLGREIVPRTMRANAIIVFCFTTVVAGIGYAATGIFTGEVALMSLALLPVYGAGMFAGSRMFGLASEPIYRRIAYASMVFVAVMTLPLFGD